MKYLYILALSLIILLIACTPTSQVQETTAAQWRGLQRTGHFNETGLLKQWPDSGLTELLVIEDIGNGYSTPVVYKDVIYVTGQQDTLDVLTAYHMNGEQLWRTPFGYSWTKSFSATRSTPTIVDDQIFVVDGIGTVACIDLAGTIAWSVDGKKEFQPAYGEWGISESLLVVDDKVIFSPVGEKTSLVALDKNTGTTLWQSPSLNDTMAYSSPIYAEHNGVRMVVAVSGEYIYASNIENGEFLWKYHYAELNPPTFHPLAPVINCVSPIYHNGEIYVTSGYDHVGVKFRLNEDATSVDTVWSDSTLDCHHGGVVMVDGYIYGSNWIHNRDGDWCCIDWETGKTMYREHWENKGSVVYADGMLYILDEKRGNVGLVQATPEEFKVISSFKVDKGRGPYWAHPSIYDGKLFIRHGEVMVVYDLRS